MTVFLNGVELTTPEEIEQALRDYYFVSSRYVLPLLTPGAAIPADGCGCRDGGVPVMRANCALHGGELVEELGPDPIWKAIARATRRRRGA